MNTNSHALSIDLTSGVGKEFYNNRDSMCGRMEDTEALTGPESQDSDADPHARTITSDVSIALVLQF